MKVTEFSMEERRIEVMGETGDPRENPPTSSIARHDSRMRKSEGHSWISTRWNCAGRCHWSTGFHGDLPFDPALAFRRCSTFNSPPTPTNWLSRLHAISDRVSNDDGAAGPESPEEPLGCVGRVGGEVPAELKRRLRPAQDAVGDPEGGARVLREVLQLVLVMVRVLVLRVAGHGDDWRGGEGARVWPQLRRRPSYHHQVPRHWPSLKSGMEPRGNPACEVKKRGSDTSDTNTHAQRLIAPTRKAVQCFRRDAALCNCKTVRLSSFRRMVENASRVAGLSRLRFRVPFSCVSVHCRPGLGATCRGYNLVATSTRNTGDIRMGMDVGKDIVYQKTAQTPEELLARITSLPLQKSKTAVSSYKPRVAEEWMGEWLSFSDRRQAARSDQRKGNLRLQVPINGVERIQRISNRSSQDVCGDFNRTILVTEEICTAQRKDGDLASQFNVFRKRAEIYEGGPGRHAYRNSCPPDLERIGFLEVVDTRMFWSALMPLSASLGWIPNKIFCGRHKVYFSVRASVALIAPSLLGLERNSPGIIERIFNTKETSHALTEIVEYGPECQVKCARVRPGEDVSVFGNGLMQPLPWIQDMRTLSAQLSDDVFRQSRNFQFAGKFVDRLYVSSKRRAVSPPQYVESSDPPAFGFTAIMNITDFAPRTSSAPGHLPVCLFIESRLIAGLLSVGQFHCVKFHKERRVGKQTYKSNRKVRCRVKPVTGESGTDKSPMEIPVPPPSLANANNPSADPCATDYNCDLTAMSVVSSKISATRLDSDTSFFISRSNKSDEENRISARMSLGKPVKSVEFSRSPRTQGCTRRPGQLEVAPHTGLHETTRPTRGRPAHRAARDDPANSIRNVGVPQR
ncbi:hypothetical protein PR048_022886 [Dryococelus australis]|uniref:Uncharacterized protein n=1 Tax=Dryococelus australis TaxID=614101 RepID=A0ABQ9GSH8_9NEOP|nr:hypothetical protein PR048_022886 [Dryococelus australis]